MPDVKVHVGSRDKTALDDVMVSGATDASLCDDNDDDDEPDLTERRRSIVVKAQAPQYRPDSPSAAMTWLQWIEVVVGVAYMAVSITASASYLDVLAPSLANDMWWPGFNASSTQGFLGDVINFYAGTNIPTPLSIDVLSPGVAVPLLRARGITPLSLSVAYVRDLVYASTDNLEDVIDGLHMYRVNGILSTSYCWVDFDKSFELARTSARQLRCASLAANAALYLEAVLRNVVWAAWDSEYGGPEGAFTLAMANTLHSLPGGTAWLVSVQDAYTDTASEARFWRSKRATTWQLQWQNAWQPGMEDTMSIQNAFGRTQALLIKKIPYAAQGAAWRTILLSLGFWNDLVLAKVLNVTLVRGTPDSMPDDWITLPIGNTDTMAASAWMTALGTYGAIDATSIPVPVSIGEVVRQFEVALVTALRTSPSVSEHFAQIDRTRWLPVPLAWRESDGLDFVGGSPLCVENAPTPYVQESFGFSDACLSHDPLEVVASRHSLVFAVALTHHAANSDNEWLHAICNGSDECVSAISAALAVVAGLDGSLWQTNRGGVAVNATLATVEVAQVAFNKASGTSALLRQPLVVENDVAWTLAGHIMLYNWATHQREVVRFEGDTGSIALISRMYEPLEFTPNGAEIPQLAGTYVRAMVLYTTTVFCFVAGVMFVYGCTTRFRVLGRNLLRFHRVVGSVWLGRVLLFGRGITAIAVLSSPSVALVERGGLASFDPHPRPASHTMLLLSEMTWVVYVGHDVLATFLPDHSYYAAPASTAISVILVALVDACAPMQLTITMDRQCTTTCVGRHVVCTSGVVHYGSPTRVVVILVILLASVVVVYVVAVVRRWRHERPPMTLLLSAVAESFLDMTAQDGGHHVHPTFDSVTCVMCGLLTWHCRDALYVFDLKSWTVTREAQETKYTVKRRSVAYEPSTAAKTYEPHPIRDRVKALLGLGYMAMSLAGSVLYIAATQVNMANDFGWVNFNATGARAYLGNFFGQGVLLYPDGFDGRLDSVHHSHDEFYNSLASVVTASTLYARSVQYEATTAIATAVLGLRSSRACDAPQIMAQYCWLDFDQQFSMAYTAERQRRCDRYRANGAVYLDAVLRNVDLLAFESCWGDAFTIAVVQEVERTARGRAWLASLSGRRVPVSEEEAHWRRHGISHYMTQFQNFREIGIVETFSIQSALGIDYPMTLKRTPATTVLLSQTSLKLYWTLSMDLALVADPTSPVANLSLVPGSATFAYQNQSVQGVMTMVSIVQQPFGLRFSALQTALGPFGTIDAWHVPCPKSLASLYATAQAAVVTAIASSPDAQRAYASITGPATWSPAPPEWQDLYRYGGNILCDDMPQATTGVIMSFWTDGGCTSLLEYLTLTKMSNFVAAIAASPVIDPSAVCACDMANPTLCLAVVSHMTSWTDASLPADDLAALRRMAVVARSDITRLNASMLQFGVDGALLLRPLFVEASPGFDFFAWAFAIEWLLGMREVVSFEGDAGTLALLRSQSPALPIVPNVLEIPQNVAFYAKGVCAYITTVLAVVAALAAVAMLASVGRVEGANALTINRVAGIVWTGRPLLFVRSVVALMLLSTTQLELHRYGPLGLVTAFKAHELEWYKVALASGEVSWFVIVLGDILTVFTGKYTATYGGPSCRLASLCVAVLSCVQPVAHRVTIARVCTMPNVDFEVACDAGTVFIGSSTRLAELIGLSVGSMALCYVYSRVRYPCLENSRRTVPPLLSNGAKYYFHLDEWMHDDCVYLDGASALITGLLFVPWRGEFYVLDIKLWRVFTFDRRVRVPRNHPLYDRVQFALPLPTLPP